jgi:hypothetical protein
MDTYASASTSSWTSCGVRSTVSEVVTFTVLMGSSTVRDFRQVWRARRVVASGDCFGLVVGDVRRLTRG